MKQGIVTLAISVAVVGCSASPKSLNDRLARGDPTVCTDRVVTQRLQEGILPQPMTPEADFKSYNVAVKKMRLSLDGVSVADVKSDEKSLVCSASIGIGYRDTDGADVKATSLTTTYEIRPTVGDEKDFVILGEFDELRRLANMLRQNITPDNDADVAANQSSSKS